MFTDESTATEYNVVIKAIMDLIRDKLKNARADDIRIINIYGVGAASNAYSIRFRYKFHEWGNWYIYFYDTHIVLSKIGDDIVFRYDNIDDLLGRFDTL